MFRVERWDPLLDAIFLLHRFGKNGNIECSPSMLSIIVPHHYLELTVAFQMMPQFFNHFFSKNTHCSKIFLQPLYSTLKRMHESQFSTISLFLLKRLDRLLIQFSSPRNKLTLIRKFGIMRTVNVEFGNIDFGTFVSIDAQQFRHVVTEFHDYFVSIIPTTSHVLFSIEVKEIVFEREQGECIIGGIRQGVNTEFHFPIYPSHIFYNITFQSERVWFFKTTDGRGTLIVAPVGLFAQFVIYFPLGGSVKM
ncbi:unnamed protein product [Citrullus colocynthis]|uniref:Maturase K n=1 Tax=Citrullus colocynthis TaxID=252529 RepID=A0ABP0Z8Q3_9ROSI